jgi:hypothetical protein
MAKTLFTHPARRVVERCQGVSGELALVSVGRTHYEIVANGLFLMATYNRRSERTLARLALDALPPARTRIRVLIGGLGVGHTLRATLPDPRVLAVTVVELEPRIIRWNRLHFKGSAEALADGRVTLVQEDFFALLRDTAASLPAASADNAPSATPADGVHPAAPADGVYEVILADTDNGPDWLVRPENHAIYGRRGLGAAFAVLAPGGVAAFWSSGPAEWFGERLTAAGFAVSAHAVPGRKVIPPDVIYLGRKPRQPAPGGTGAKGAGDR